MYCHNCGTKLGADWKFCTKCGKEIKSIMGNDDFGMFSDEFGMFSEEHDAKLNKAFLKSKKSVNKFKKYMQEKINNAIDDYRNFDNKDLD